MFLGAFILNIMPIWCFTGLKIKSTPCLISSLQTIIHRLGRRLGSWLGWCLGTWTPWVWLLWSRVLWSRIWSRILRCRLSSPSCTPSTPTASGWSGSCSSSPCYYLHIFVSKNPYFRTMYFVLNQVQTHKCINCSMEKVQLFIFSGGWYCPKCRQLNPRGTDTCARCFHYMYEGTPRAAQQAAAAQA